LRNFFFHFVFPQTVDISEREIPKHKDIFVGHDRKISGAADRFNSTLKRYQGPDHNIHFLNYF